VQDWNLNGPNQQTPLVPYSDGGFGTCVETVAAMDSGCPICRRPITMVLRVFN